MCLAWWAIDIDPVIAVVSLEFLVRLQDSSPPTQNSEEPKDLRKRAAREAIPQKSGILILATESIWIAIFE